MTASRFGGMVMITLASTFATSETICASCLEKFDGTFDCADGHLRVDTQGVPLRLCGGCCGSVGQSSSVRFYARALSRGGRGSESESSMRICL